MNEGFDAGRASQTPCVPQFELLIGHALHLEGIADGGVEHAGIEIPAGGGPLGVDGLGEGTFRVQTVQRQQ